jgi:hypothetical protein
MFGIRGANAKPSSTGAHIVALMPNATARDRLIDSLNGSMAYGQHVLAKPVTDWRRLQQR